MHAQINCQADIFKSVIAVVVEKYGLREENWTEPAWKSTYALIDQNVLDHAFNDKRKAVETIFSGLGVVSRPSSKSLTRVRVKQEDGKYRKKIENVVIDNYFRPISDFLAMRIDCQLSEMENKIVNILLRVSSEGGWCCLRGQKEKQPFGSYKSKDNSYSAIQQYAYVFFRHIGYPIEIQINHEFATYAFTVDTENREKKPPQQPIFDTDWGQEIKKYILDKANKKNVENDKKEIMRKVHQAHPQGIPTKLNEIIARL